MEFQFAGGAYETFSKNLNAQECVNFFTHVDQEGGVSKLSLRGTPGLKEWVDTEHDGAVRGLIEHKGYLYAVVRKRVYRITSGGVKVLCDGNLLTSTGKVSMATNGTQLVIVDGLNGYILTDTVLTTILDDGFPDNPQSVTSQDSYFIVSAKDSRYAFISDVGDGSSWDSTVYVIAGGQPDNILSVISDHKDLFLLGEKTIETAYNSGGDPPFAYRPGSLQEVGIGAKDSVDKLDNTIFFLTNKYQVVRFQGNNPVAISTRSVEYQIAQYETKSDAIGMGIMIEGNAFYVLTFPSANETWCYNAATGFWNKITSNPGESRWRGNCYVNFADKHIVGDFGNGKLYEWDFETYLDNSELIRRIRTTGSIRQEGKKMFHHRLEIFFESGVGLITGQGSDPQAMLQYSNDGGHTWSSELWRSIGKIGKYSWRAVWNRLGSCRNRNYKLVVTDPVKWVVTEANLEVTVGRT